MEVTIMVPLAGFLAWVLSGLLGGVYLSRILRMGPATWAVCALLGGLLFMMAVVVEIMVMIEEGLEG